ncbi:MAG: pyruvate, water dikinase regulatory protein [Planctomycetota bacterium]
MSNDAPRHIYLLSDGTCRTCETVVKAVLVQFEQPNIHLIRKANVRRAQTVRRLMQQAARAGALVFYTLVSEEPRKAIEDAAREYMVPAVDLLAPVMVSLYDLFKSAPRAKPGILYKSNKAHYDRIDAVEYTLHHDDGVGVQELDQADVVLVGVSRSSKSTTCFYLAYRGIRAANVPLFADSPPPAELLRIDPRRVIGMAVNPHRLLTVRETRLRGWGMGLDEEYASKATIARELRAANEQMVKYGWRRIDVSYKAIEEIAREVRQLLADAGINFD